MKVEALSDDLAVWTAPHPGRWNQFKEINRRNVTFENNPKLKPTQSRMAGTVQQTKCKPTSLTCIIGVLLQVRKKLRKNRHSVSVKRPRNRIRPDRMKEFLQSTRQC